MAKPIIYSFDQSEKWLPVVGYEGLYDVSERGGVRSYRRTGKSGTFSTALPMTLAISNVGYPRVSLRTVGAVRAKHHTVHRLVARAFIGPCPDGHNVNHKNGVKTDNRVENLEYTTHQENVDHSIRTGLKPTGPYANTRRGSNSPASKLSDDDAREVFAMLARGETTISVGQRFGINPATVSRMKTGRNWIHLRPENFVAGTRPPVRHTFRCAVCGGPFSDFPCRNRKTCSHECRSQLALRGRWGPTVRVTDITCGNCGTTFTGRHKKSERRFCSNRCKSVFAAKARWHA